MATSTSSAQSFEPTPRLLASARAAGPAVEDAKSIRPSYIPLHINFQKIEKDYDEFYQQNEAKLQQSIRPPANVLHKYTLLLQSGIFRLDSRTSMIGAVVLHKTEDLCSVINLPDGERDLVWGEVGTVHFIPGNSIITSSGDATLGLFSSTLEGEVQPNLLVDLPFKAKSAFTPTAPPNSFFELRISLLCP